MLWSIPVVDETILLIVEIHPEEHMVPHNYYSYRTESFLSFTVTNHQPHQASKRWSSLEVAIPRPLEIQSLCLTMFWKIAVLLATCFGLTLTSTISLSIVAVDIDSCGVFISKFSWPCSLKDPSTQLPSHNWHNRKFLVNREAKLHLNSATALYCNSNQVAIHYMIHHDCFHRQVLPRF